MIDRLPLFACALWWGSLTAVGFMVVPLLFVHLPTPAMAGQMAARLFTAQTWVSVVCCVVLILLNRRSEKAPMVQSDSLQSGVTMVFILLGLLLALMIEYGVAPRIVARQNLRLWHSAGSVMYGVQWLCACIVLWRLAGRR